MPEYGTDPDTGLPITGLTTPEPAESLAQIARNTAGVPDLGPLIRRLERIMADLKREIAQWPPSAPPDRWEQLVADVTERLRGSE